MQFYYVPLSLLALALSSTVGAQYGLTDIPNCARTAALTGITQTRCPITDLSCICKNQDWITKLLPDVEKACDDEDFQSNEPRPFMEIFFFSFFFPEWGKGWKKFAEKREKQNLADKGVA